MEGLGRKTPVQERKFMETMYLYEMVVKYPSRMVVYIVDNGDTIFHGVVGAMQKYLDAETLARQAHIYISELDYSANVYLQRR